MKKIASITCSLILMAVLIGNNPSVSAQSGNTLYKRLGGYDAIAKVTDEFLYGLAKDKQLSRFLTGLARVRENVCASMWLIFFARQPVVLACTPGAI